MVEANQSDGAQGAQLSLSPDEARVVRTLIASLRRIRYGSVQIVVQDGRVVQVDTLEKQRLNYKEPDYSI